jgi:hypothetical protein
VSKYAKQSLSLWLTPVCICHTNSSALITCVNYKEKASNSWKACYIEPRAIYFGNNGIDWIVVQVSLY